MPFYLNHKQRDDLIILGRCSSDDVIELCKSAFDYLTHGPNEQRYVLLAKKHNCNATLIKRVVEALISILIDATKSRTVDAAALLQKEIGVNVEVADILAQFVTSKRNFMESSIKTANLRAYRLVNLNWRLEVCVASRSLLRQCTIQVTMKLFLHTEPKSENRDLTEKDKPVHPDELQNRKNLIVQTDVASLKHMIQSLEDALVESRTRRIRNIVDAIH